MSEAQPIIEHEPSVGTMSKHGFNGQTIAIVAHSHHYGEIEHEGANFTKRAIEEVKLDKRHKALVAIQKYFGASDDPEFWEKVIFFNFLPSCVGQSDEKYGKGTVAQIERGQERFKRILFEYAVDKVLVFTAKGWSDCPQTIEEMATDSVPIPLSAEFPHFSYGTYSRDGHIVTAYGLRHPQFATSEEMERAVRYIMSLPTANSASQ